MPNYLSYEKIQPTDERNPYSIELLNKDNDSGYMRITPPVYNLDGFLREAEYSCTTEFEVEQITAESTILALNFEGFATYPPDSDAHMQEARSMAEHLLHQLGAGVNEELFKSIQ